MDILELVEQGKIKRIFRARNKIIFAGAVAHIIQRAPGRELLFLEEKDYLYMLHLIKETAYKFNFNVWSFVLMPNHIHLLVKFFEVNASQAMKNLYERYADYFNKKYERKGHVFYGPYRSALCFDETYLISASIYIHINPVKAGIIDKPEKYRWSSCRAFLNPPKKKSFLNCYPILQILNNNTSNASQIYKELLDNTEKIKIRSVLEDPTAVELFRLKLFRFFSKLLYLKDVIKRKAFVDEIELDKKIIRLKKKKKLRSIEDMRARKYLIEQLRSRGFTIREIIERLRISRRTFYYTLNYTK
ncbi:MAG: transposase [Candidatus Omnitrophica bacterium]|nr:transposase [Candidatus Omnitrophota bacterium]